MIAYPQYLDVPMMVSILASLEDGIPSTGALAALGIDLEGRVGAELQPTTAAAIAQRQTVGSLFCQLRAHLAGQTARVESADDLAALTDGQFVELVGVVARNPMVEFVNVMERLFSISNLPAGQPLEIDADEETRKMFGALRQELDGSPVVDATLTTDAGLQAILSLSKVYLGHTSLDDLRFGRVRVLGKAVGTLPAGQSWSVLRRSLVGHMMSAAFDEAMSGLVQVNPDNEFPVQSQVEGPAVFIVPLAVFI